ncbi:MAG: hypothetical protein AAGA30_03660 [Planctomycetota bacterium]
MKFSPKKFQDRGAVATIELAVCLPIMAVIVFAPLAATSTIFLRAAAVQSAYEVVREAVKVDGDLDVARARGASVLTFRNITPVSIDITPANVGDQAPGTPITVTVAVQTEGNGVFAFGPFGNRTIEVQSVMMKE